MEEYGVREVEKLLRLPRSTIRTLVHAGFVSPARGPRNAWRFSFRDLIVLRTAQALVEARVPAKRITRSMRELRSRLPETMPLSGLSIGAVADRVVVREGASRWQADTGQYLLAFEGDPHDGSLSVIPRAEAAPDAEGLLEHALALEEEDFEGAARTYRAAIEMDGALVEAHVNLGRLLHERGRLDEAEAAYRAGLAQCPAHSPDGALLQYNLGVALADLGRKEEAVGAYEAALAARPRFADCHYNLALLCEELGRPRDAIRHMAQYRRLTRKPEA